MVDEAIDIIRLLSISADTDFEFAVDKAFKFLGFDSKRIGSQQDAEVDIIAESKWSNQPFKIVCECNAVGNRQKVKSRKLGQIRSNGPKHGLDGTVIYLVIVGKPKFAATTIRNSPPDVCLLLAEDLAKLVGFHEIQNFSNETLEGIFARSGEAAGNVESLLEFHKRRLERFSTLYALICVVTENLLSESTDLSMMTKQDLPLIIRNSGRMLGLGNFSGDEIIEGINVMSSPILNVFSTVEEKIVLKGKIEEALAQYGKLGKFIIDRLQEIRNISDQSLKTAMEKDGSY